MTDDERPPLSRTPEEIKPLTSLVSALDRSRKFPLPILAQGGRSDVRSSSRIGWMSLSRGLEAAVAAGDAQLPAKDARHADLEQRVAELDAISARRDRPFRRTRSTSCRTRSRANPPPSARRHVPGHWLVAAPGELQSLYVPAPLGAFGFSNSKQEVETGCHAVLNCRGRHAEDAHRWAVILAEPESHNCAHRSRLGRPPDHFSTVGASTLTAPDRSALWLPPRGLGRRRRRARSGRTPLCHSRVPNHGR
jgi:hypothetical protein